MDILQKFIDELAAQILGAYTACKAIETKLAKAYEALTGKPIEPPESGTAEVAAITNELKGSADDLETSVRESQP